MRGYYGDCESAIQPDACSAEQVLIVLPKISSCLTVASPSEINSDDDLGAIVPFIVKIVY